MKNTTIEDDNNDENDIALNILIEVLMMTFYSIGIVLQAKLFNTNKA